MTATYASMGAADASRATNLKYDISIRFWNRLSTETTTPTTAKMTMPASNRANGDSIGRDFHNSLGHNARKSSSPELTGGGPVVSSFISNSGKCLKTVREFASR